MNSRQADALSNSINDSLAAGNVVEAFDLLRPILEERTPFRLLDRIAKTVGAELRTVNRDLMACIAGDGSEGGWVIIGSMLHQEYARQPADAVADCWRYIVAADCWYGADILGERVPGPALMDDFVTAEALLAPWRYDANRWVRRSVGVATHFWAKRSKGEPALLDRAQDLLEFLGPMFEEREMDAVKGLGWGLKTLGRYYPERVTGWLLRQRDRPHRRLMVRKALTYLPDDQRDKVLGAYGL